MQYIKKDGVKRFAKDSKKEGCFHPVGGFEALAVAPVLVISEGYATSASLAEVLGHATISAFDSGNLVPVAKDLHDKYPNKPIIIAGDDDREIEIKQGINPGRMKAEEAATAVGGKAIFPIFAPGEQDVNPAAYSDFNDLATKSLLGKNGIERQVKAEIGRVTINTDQPLKQKQIKHQQTEREMRRAKTIKVS